MRASARFVSAVVIAGASVTAIIATSTEPLGHLLAWFGYVKALGWVKDQLEIMQEVCGGYVGMLVGSTAVEAADSTASAARAQSLASGSVAAQSVARLRAQAATGLAFNDGEPALLDVVLKKSLSAEVSDRVLVAVSRVVSAHRALAATLSGVLTLPGADLINALAALKRDSTEPARTLLLEAMTAGFSGSIDPVLDGQGQPTGRFTVVFTSTVAPSSDAPIPFSFRLHDTTADYLGPVINATLQMPLTPVARDLAFETNLDTTLNARLTATHATGFALVELPASGSLTLTNAATGAFTYTPSTGFSGTVGFTYLASNDRATSQTATVVVAVLGAQVQCALSDSSDSFTLSYRRECKHYLASGAVTDEGFWSAALPDAIQRYWRIGGDQDYISLSENFSRSPGLSALVGVASVGHDTALEQFTLNRSSGHYDPDTGALAQPSPTFTGQDNDLRLQSQRERVTFRKHPVSGLFIVHSMQRALLQRSYLVNGTVVVDRLERAAATLQALDAQGAPTYVTETIRCWRPSTLDSGGYALTSGAEWTVEQVTTTNRTETSRTFTADGVCPLSATTLLNGVGPEKGLNDLSFDWRNPPLPSGG